MINYKLADFETEEKLNEFLNKLSTDELREFFKLQQNLIIEESKKDFWEYQKARIPTWYKNDRIYLKTICRTFQAVYEKKIINPKSGKPYQMVIVNAPPQHGKSLTVQGFISWLLGQDPTNRIISISYNEILSSRFGKSIRDSIKEEKSSGEKFIVNDFFPSLEINHQDSSRTFWALTEQHFNFLGSSPNGTVTGIGANIMIIDDLVKNALEANNKRILNEHWDFYTDTLISRSHENALWFVIMTRWHTLDLCGRLLAEDPDDILLLSFEAYNEKTGEMLAPSVMSYDTYIKKTKKTSEKIISANYKQKPIDDQEGDLLYDRPFRTYFDRLEKYNDIFAYCDLKDKGEDYFSCGVVGEDEEKKDLHVLDWLHTPASMEYTKPRLAEMLVKYNVKWVVIETNNNSYFVTSLKEYLKEKYPTYKGKIIELHQKLNKEARILTTAFDVNTTLMFPDGWQNKNPKLYEHLQEKTIKNLLTLDDAVDVAAGLIEIYQDKQNKNKKKKWKGYKMRR